MILEELGVPCEIKPIKFDDVKKKPFTDINPNGRVPGMDVRSPLYPYTVTGVPFLEANSIFLAIQDPNTDLTLWESGAIIQYIIEQYDVKRTLTYDTLKERHHLNQWLQFQMSGQGPYYGVSAW